MDALINTTDRSHHTKVSTNPNTGTLRSRPGVPPRALLFRPETLTITSPPPFAQHSQEAERIAVSVEALLDRDWLWLSCVCYKGVRERRRHVTVPVMFRSTQNPDYFALNEV